MASSTAKSVQDAADVQNSRALDCVCLFSADIGGGVGPYLATFLRSTRHWDSASIGLQLSALGVAGMIAGIPAGAVIDRIKHKRFVVAVAACVIGLSALSFTIFNSFYEILIAQIACGIAAAFLGLGVISLSLGLVGRQRFASRMGRNEAFTHIGNVLSALAIGTLGSVISHDWMFYLIAILAGLSVVALCFIREDQLQNNVVYKPDPDKSTQDKSTPADMISLWTVLKDSRLIAFAVAAFLFNLANGAMLPLAAQYLSEGSAEFAPAYTAACIFSAQAIMIPAAILSGKFAQKFGRKPVFAVAMAALLLRGLLYTAFAGGPAYVITVQLLDGIGAGIFGVLASVIIADLAGHTGHYNITRATIGTVQSIGGSISFLMAGSVVKALGYSAGFGTLSVIALIGLLFFLFAVPETRPKPV